MYWVNEWRVEYGFLSAYWVFKAASIKVERLGQKICLFCYTPPCSGSWFTVLVSSFHLHGSHWGPVLKVIEVVNRIIWYKGEKGLTLQWFLCVKCFLNPISVFRATKMTQWLLPSSYSQASEYTCPGSPRSWTTVCQTERPKVLLGIKYPLIDIKN